MKLIVVALCLAVAQAQWVKEQENPDLWEGDIVLDPDEKEVRNGQTFASIKGGRWPTTINYVIERSMQSGGRSAIKAAVAEYHRTTCLRFVEGSTRGAHLSFYMGGGCSSPVGHRSGRKNRISLARGCWRIGTVMHEIGHSIGLYHEQSRPDRDQYVEILWGNIKGGMDYNFRKQTTKSVDSLGTPYDYKSMMHYGPYGFGGGSMTIRTKDPSMQKVIGQRRGPSEIDIKQINLMYCSGTGPQPSTGPRPQPTEGPSGNCKDYNRRCAEWARRSPSECKVNPRYMLRWCKKSCKVC